MIFNKCKIYRALPGQQLRLGEGGAGAEGVVVHNQGGDLTQRAVLHQQVKLVLEDLIEGIKYKHLPGQDEWFVSFSMDLDPDFCLMDSCIVGHS